MPTTVGELKRRAARGHHNNYSYQDVAFDAKGWATATEWLPRQYDLCDVITSEKKRLTGWHTGSGWDGLNLEKYHIIIKWRRIHDNA